MGKTNFVLFIVAVFLHLVGMAYFSGKWREECKQKSNDMWCELSAKDAALVWQLSLVSELGRRSVNQSN